jgi:hypothetical protein
MPKVAQTRPECHPRKAPSFKQVSPDTPSANSLSINKCQQHCSISYSSPRSSCCWPRHPPYRFIHKRLDWLIFCLLLRSAFFNCPFPVTPARGKGSSNHTFLRLRQDRAKAQLLALAKPPPVDLSVFTLPLPNSHYWSGLS